VFRRIYRWTAIGLITAMALVAAVYLRDMHRYDKRIRGISTIIPSPYGNIEYTTGGSGPAVLVIHGSGGGFDQGELLVQAVLGNSFRWITPSRFGYLHSTFREGATWDDQAHAYACLLDRLGLKKVAVVALSQGGPSATLFAVLHPERVSSLTLISAGVASSATPDQAQANQKGEMWVKIFKYDPLFWAINKLFERQLLGLMGANETVIAGLTYRQRELAKQVINDMNPVSVRYAGVVFDNKERMPDSRIAAIRAPTLIFHATDDTLQIYHNAEFAAANIPGAKLFRFERGGHLLMVVEQETIRKVMQKHILDHMSEEDSRRSGSRRF